MRYMVRKTFLYGVSFHIVYNEVVRENMNKLENLFLPHRVQKKINLLTIEMEVCETALCHHTNTYVYQIGAFKFRLLVRIWNN